MVDHINDRILIGSKDLFDYDDIFLVFELKSFLDFIINKFDETGMRPEKICFEITETAAIANLSMASNFINTLRNIGCSFALDDFGSGLSSFGYLKNLPVDFIKIDGMFVRDIADDAIDQEMVRSITNIAKAMGKQTIAEFVDFAVALR